jgi:Trypsin-like peptidase domain
VTQNDSTNAPGISDLEYGSLAWRITVARTAHAFFNPLHPQRAATAALINKPFQEATFDVWNVSDFTRYLQKIGMQPGDAAAVTRILGAMERAALLLSAGWDASYPLLGQRYVSQGRPSAQFQGNLWLSDVLGPDLIIESHKLVTVHLTRADGAPGGGTGLVLDRSHVLTNKHVAKAVAPNVHVESLAPATGDQGAGLQCSVHLHNELDVAVIEVQSPDSGLFIPLDGMVFRDPAWADEVYLLGYPRVPWMVGTDITLQRGEVVNPLVETPPVRDDDTEAAGIIPSRGKAFLYSAIARPGNSGGPIVAHDGRVIGIVVESTKTSDSSDPSQGAGAEREQMCPTVMAIWKELRQFVNPESGGAPEDAQPTDDEAPSAPLYRGIPTSEIVRALDDFKLGSLVVVENPV